MGLTPTFHLEVQNQDITAVIEHCLLSLTLNDYAGMESDTAEIVLSDPDSALLLPPVGSMLRIDLGYQETTLENMGVYIVDELELSSAPAQLRIRAKSANMHAAIKAPKTRTWHNGNAQITLKNLVETIAHEHGLKSKITPELADVSYARVHQTQESDLNLLTRLTASVDAFTKIAGQHILVFKKENDKTINLPTISLAANHVLQWRLALTGRDHYQSVQAQYWDQETATQTWIRAGEGNPCFTLRTPFSNHTEALQAAHAQLKQFTRNQRKLTLDIIGDPQITAHTPLHISAVHDDVEGHWLVESITHRFTARGYTASLCAIPKSEN